MRIVILILLLQASIYVENIHFPIENDICLYYFRFIVLSPRLRGEVHVVVILPAQKGQKEVETEQDAYDV